MDGYGKNPDEYKYPLGYDKDSDRYDQNSGRNDPYPHRCIQSKYKNYQNPDRYGQHPRNWHS